MEAIKARKAAKIFELGEKLLCYHGPLLYEAKVLKVDNKNENDPLYFIHYNGWNKNYDEWVDSKRILKLNDKNVQLKDDLLKAALNKSANNSVPSLTSVTTSNSNKSSPSSTSSYISFKPKTNTPTVSNNNTINTTSQVSDNSSSSSSRRKRFTTNGDTSSNESEKSVETTTTAVVEKNLVSKKYEIINPNQEFDQYLTKNEFKINMSNELKDILLDDWDFITHQNKLTALPCEKNVSTILNDYTASNDGLKDDLKEYFNIMLGSQLLYKFERIQYMQIIADHPNKELTEIYGLVHLLRLFAKLGNIISYAPLEEASLHQLLLHIHDILKFLDTKHKEYYNDSNYILASPEYVRRAFV